LRRRKKESGPRENQGRGEKKGSEDDPALRFLSRKQRKEKGKRRRGGPGESDEEKSKRGKANGLTPSHARRKEGGWGEIMTTWKLLF